MAYASDARLTAATVQLRRRAYDVLLEKGRVATEGIFFDVNSDVIRPESGATLEEISTMRLVEILAEGGMATVCLRGEQPARHLARR